MNWVMTMNIAICLSAAATAAIAVLAFFNFQLALAINQRDNEHKEQTADLYKAIVIMTGVASGGRRSDVVIDDFQNRYDRAGGKTEIFPRRRKS